MGHIAPEKPVQINKHIFAKFEIENWIVLICITLSPLHSRMPSAKFGWNWPSGSGEENFLILSIYFRYFVFDLLLEKGVALHVKKFKSLIPKDALCQHWLKSA